MLLNMLCDTVMEHKCEVFLKSCCQLKENDCKVYLKKGNYQMINQGCCLTICSNIAISLNSDSPLKKVYLL